MKERCEYGVINESLILTTVYSLISGACQQAPSGVVAQLGERLVCTQEVASSILADSTYRSKKMRTQ